MMQYTLTGFTQAMGFRIFAYQGTGADRVRIAFTVRADLALSRKYGIRIQDLPLMCMGILERSNHADEAADTGLTGARRALTFTEAQMSSYETECVAARDAAALKRKSPRRQPSRTPAPCEFNPFREPAPAGSPI